MDSWIDFLIVETSRKGQDRQREDHLLFVKAEDKDVKTTIFLFWPKISTKEMMRWRQHNVE